MFGDHRIPGQPYYHRDIAPAFLQTADSDTISRMLASVLCHKYVTFQRAAQGLWLGAARRTYPAYGQGSQQRHSPCAARPSGGRKTTDGGVAALAKVQTFAADRALPSAVLRPLKCNVFVTQDTSANVPECLPGRARLFVLLLAAMTAHGCGDTGMQPVRLTFSLDSPTLDCGARPASGQLGFYVSGLRMIDEQGAVAAVLLDTTPTQSTGDGVALVSWNGTCAPNSTADANRAAKAIPHAGATAVNNPVVAGRVARARYHALEFELGVPFERNHANPLAAPAPLNVPSMFWTWQTGYKFLRLDIGTDWSFHLGSTGCISESAVRPPEGCGQPNRVTIRLPAEAAFEGATVVDLDTLLADVDTASAASCVDDYGDLALCRRLLARLGIDADTGNCIGDCGSQVLFRYENAGR